MPKRHTGSIRERKTKNGVVYYARLDYTDESGKRKAITRRCATKSDALRAKAELAREYEDRIATGGPARPVAVKFAAYAEQYKAAHLTEPRYEHGKKLEGMIGWRNERRLIDTVLVPFFGHRQLQSIRYSDIARFKSERLKLETWRKEPRKVASVHRELARLHAMLREAVRDGLLKSDPFQAGRALVNPSLETMRTRVLSAEEEAKLLEACLLEGRPEMQPIIVCALATGMRQGQILKLTWRDVDLDAGIITVRTYKGSSLKLYEAAITDRLRAVLYALRERSGGEPDARVFYCGSFRHVWGRVKKRAGLAPFVFHDLRHSTATRLINRGVPIEHVARLLGHSDVRVTFRYVSTSREDLKRAAEVLDAFDGEAGEGRVN
jgi:integrase